MRASADAVVIGAGIIGCSVALELARSGLDVVVVDKGSGPGQGSTSASSAVMRFNYSTLAGVATAWEAFHCWQNWTEHLEWTPDGAPARYHRTGVVMIDSPLAPRQRAWELFDEVGISYENWDAEELARRVPGIDTGRYWPPKPIQSPDFWKDADGQVGALFTPDGGFVDDPLLAAVNTAEAARAHGVRFEWRRHVTGILRTENKTGGVVFDDSDQLHSPVAVNCTGPWSAALNRNFGIDEDFKIVVRPMRQEVHEVPAPAGYAHGNGLGPVIADLDLGIYLRPTPGGGMLVGGTEPECDPFEWIENPDTFNPNRTAAAFEAQVTRAARRFPDLRVPGQPTGVAGVYDVAADWAPIYDRTSLDGLYVAIGTSGNQFKNAPVVGQMMAALVTAVQQGHDHDAHPVQFTCARTARRIDLGAFSRRRAINPDSTGTVMG
jgi:glycine/D-amino acid oxidase-like deaminating enzyme